MAFDNAYFNLGYIDRLSYHDSVIHRIDPRAKVICTALFLLAVVSYPKYEISALVPFFLYPAILMTLGDIPIGFVIRRVLAVSPFVVFVGIFNPVFDRHIAFELSGVSVSAGWVSFFSIILKFVLSMSAALILIATTSFPRICSALEGLGLPRLFITQLVFLYRYMFVLMEEALRMVRARDIRSFGKRGTGINVFVRLTGVLFLRTISRAETILSAMLARGFQGRMPQARQYRFALRDYVFVSMAIAYLLFCRFMPVTEMLGDLLMRFR